MKRTDQPQRGDEISLTPEDDAILDRIWDKLGAEAAAASMGRLLLAIVAHVTGVKAGDPQARAGMNADLDRLRAALEQAASVRKRPGLQVRRLSPLSRRLTVPWVVLSYRAHADGARRGVYCAYLFKADSSGVYLSLTQGADRQGDAPATAAQVAKVVKHRDRLRTELFVQHLVSHGFVVDGDLDTAASEGSAGHLFELTTVAYKYYTRDNMPADAQLFADLEFVFAAYDAHIKAAEH